MMLVSKRLPALKVPLGFNVIASSTDPRVLNRMFRSIEGIADQIVVIMDEKAGPFAAWIANQYTDEVYLYHWERDFALARNRGLERTRTPYIAWIDSDEWMGRWDAARLHNLMSRPLGLAYYIWQVSPTPGGSTLYVPQIRIFPNVAGAEWKIPIHEQILPSLVKAGVKTQLTDLRIEHLGYLNPDTLWRKHRRNLKLLQREVRRNPQDAFTRSNYDKALAFERAHKTQVFTS